MSISLESSSPIAATALWQESSSFMGSPPLISPSSDKRFWSSLRNRVDSLLENQMPADLSMPAQSNGGEIDNRAKRLKEDSMLLLRGFDSVASTLSQLSNNLENALQGARDLARPPTLSDIVHSTLENAKKQSIGEEGDKEGDESERINRGLKRKLDSEDQGDDLQAKSPKELGKLDKAKNIAISMAKKASTLAREMKSIKSDVCFMKERCSLLEEENRRLRDGFAKGMRPDDDDLMRLQMEALLAEKSRLANENADLTRENQSLHQLVEYHQHTSQELSETYENVMRGMCLDFSSPIPEEEEREERDGNDYNEVVPITPRRDLYGILNSVDEEQHWMEGKI